MFIPRTDRIAVLAGLLFLGGCADYMSHRDTVTVGAGSAKQANIGIHTVQPIPRPDAVQHFSANQRSACARNSVAGARSMSTCPSGNSRG